MEMALAGLYTGGDYDSQAFRIEHYGERIAVPTDAKAHEMLDAALHWFEAEAHDHKARSGLEALYLGAYELVSKVSLILAAPEGLRTAEHVRWAFAMIRRDVEEKALLVTANQEEEGSHSSRGLMARLAQIIGSDEGETLGVIKNRTRKYKADDVEKALSKMVAAGVLTAEEIKPKRGKATIRYIVTE